MKTTWILANKYMKQLDIWGYENNIDIANKYMKQLIGMKTTWI